MILKLCVGFTGECRIGWRLFEGRVELRTTVFGRISDMVNRNPVTFIVS